MQELWPVARVAKYLGVSKRRIYNLIETGRLESLKLSPKGTRVPRASIEAYVEQLKERRRVDLGLDLPRVTRRSPF